MSYLPKTIHALLTAIFCIFFTSCRRPEICLPPVAPGEIVYFVPNQQRMLALTFDDGPTVVATDQILQALKKHNARGTFFLLGTNVNRHPDIARRIAEEGHQIGNHSFSHLRYDQIPFEAMVQDITAGADAIEQACGARPNWFRPPYGINGAGMVEVCKSNGFIITGWSGQASDWNPHAPNEIVDRIVNEAVSGDILLLHDGWETRVDAYRPNTLAAVEPMLVGLISKGFKLVTLEELRRNAGPPLAVFQNGTRLLGISILDHPHYPGGFCYIRYFWQKPEVWHPSLAAFVHIESDSHFRFQNDHQLPVRSDVRALMLEQKIIIPTNAPLGNYSFKVGLFHTNFPSRRVAISWSASPIKKDAVILSDFLRITEKPESE